MDLSKVIYEQYKLNLESVELLQDTDDLVYKITDKNQQHYTVKIQRKLNRTNDISELCNWLDFLSKTVTFNFPIPLRNVNDCFQSQIQDESQAIYNFVVYRWVDGEPISKYMNKQNNQKIGALMAQLHNASSLYNRNATALNRYDRKWLRDCFQKSKLIFMNLSFKDTKFIIEALKNLINTYNQRLEEIEDNDEYDDEASELGNDALFLESLCSELETNLKENKTSYLNTQQTTQSLDNLLNSVLQLSINERLLLVEAISESIRNDGRLKAS